MRLHELDFVCMHSYFDTHLDTHYPILSVIAASLVPTAVSGQHCPNQVESLQAIICTQPCVKYLAIYLLCE